MPPARRGDHQRERPFAPRRRRENATSGTCSAGVPCAGRFPRASLTTSGVSTVRRRSRARGTAGARRHAKPDVRPRRRPRGWRLQRRLRLQHHHPVVGAVHRTQPGLPEARRTLGERVPGRHAGRRPHLRDGPVPRRRAPGRLGLEVVDRRGRRLRLAAESRHPDVAAARFPSGPRVFGSLDRSRGGSSCATKLLVLRV